MCDYHAVIKVNIDFEIEDGTIVPLTDSTGEKIGIVEMINCDDGVFGKVRFDVGSFEIEIEELSRSFSLVTGVT